MGGDDFTPRILLPEIAVRQGIHPTCMHCHKIRSDRERWERIEQDSTANSPVRVNHRVCPECPVNHGVEEILSSEDGQGWRAAWQGRLAARQGAPNKGLA